MVGKLLCSLLLASLGRKEAVLGATALEGLGFMIDPVAKKLVPRDLLAL
jgi:hypothetical protein